MTGGRRGAHVALAVAAILVSRNLTAQEVVPVHQEPRHRPVWEDGPVRVLDVRIPPGDTSLYHLHDAAILYVPIAVSALDAQPLGGRWSGVGPTDPSRFQVGTVAADTQYAAAPFTHRVANVGAGLFRLIAITNGGPGNAAAADSALPGAVETSSSWFRQTRLSLAANAVTGWYTPAQPLVLVQPGPGSVSAERESGTEVLEGAGAWAYLPAGARFRLRNDGPAGAIVLVQVR